MKVYWVVLMHMIEIPLKKMTGLKSKGKIMPHIFIKRQVEEGAQSSSEMH